MDWIHLESSTIDAVRYHDQKSLLEIRFRSGATYQYTHVPRKLYDDLLTSGSKTDYANEYIYSKFLGERID